MKICKKPSEEQGFTLIESIIVVTLVLLGISGIIAGWHLTDSKDRSLENYWRHKETLELAYQVTHQTLRSSAILSTISINSGQAITFTGTDGLSRTFLKENNDYKFICNGREEVLIKDICDSVLFDLNGSIVDIALGVTLPFNWNGNNDLNIEGTVLIRNH